MRGPNVMPGYLNKPEETAKALRNGWYHTGDLAKADANNFLTITGRLKELIIRGGQNIAPAEIEEVVNTFPPVLDCAVVGAPHEHLGEVPLLFVVPRAGADGREPRRCWRIAARISRPTRCRRRCMSSPEIPRTGSGKIIRYKLKELVRLKSKVVARVEQSETRSLPAATAPLSLALKWATDAVAAATRHTGS